MDWQDLLTAFALYLVLEGLIPFLSPARFRGFAAKMSQLPDAILRRFGVGSMAAGVALLYFVR